MKNKITTAHQLYKAIEGIIPAGRFISVSRTITRYKNGTIEQVYSVTAVDHVFDPTPYPDYILEILRKTFSHHQPVQKGGPS